MPRENMIYDVFVSSPSDVVDENDIIKEVISEINSIHSKDKGSSLNYVDFKNSTYPDMGNHPQEVINNQIGDFDIIIAIFWSKLGTPTPVSDSGTIDEIKNAVSRREKGELVKIAIYFSSVPISPKDIDNKEFERLESYKSEVRNGYSKFLCGEYDSIDEFKKIIRRDLEKMFIDSISDFEDSISFKKDIDSKREITDTVDRVIKDFNRSLNIIEEMNTYVLDSIDFIDEDVSVNILNSFNNKLSSYDILFKDIYFNSSRSYYNLLINKDSFILDENNKDFREIVSILRKLSKVVNSLFSNFELFENKLNSIELDTESTFARNVCIGTINKISENINKGNNPLVTYFLFTDEEFGDILSKSY